MLSSSFISEQLHMWCVSQIFCADPLMSKALSDFLMHTSHHMHTIWHLSRNCCANGSNTKSADKCVVYCNFKSNLFTFSSFWCHRRPIDQLYSSVTLNVPSMNTIVLPWQLPWIFVCIGLILCVYDCVCRANRSWVVCFRSDDGNECIRPGGSGWLPQLCWWWYQHGVITDLR